MTATNQNPATKILAQLRAQGVTLELDDGNLRAKAANGARFSNDTRALIRAHAPALAELLAGEVVEIDLATAAPSNCTVAETTPQQTPTTPFVPTPPQGREIGRSYTPRPIYDDEYYDEHGRRYLDGKAHQRAARRRRP